MNLKQIAQKLGGYIQSKTQDDEGWVRQNKFTPSKQVQQMGQNLSAWGNIANQGIKNQIDIQKRDFNQYTWQPLKENPVLAPTLNRFEQATPAIGNQLKQLNPFAQKQTPQQNWQDTKKIGAAALTAYGLVKAPLSAILGGAAISPLVKLGTNIYENKKGADLNKKLSQYGQSRTDAPLFAQQTPYQNKPITQGVPEAIFEGAGQGLANAGTTRLTNSLVGYFSGSVPFLNKLTEESIKKGTPVVTDTLKQGTQKFFNTAGKRLIKAAVLETAVESPIWATFTQSEQETYLEALQREAIQNLEMNVGMAGIQSLGDARSLTPIVKKSVDDAVNNYFKNASSPESLKRQAGYIDFMGNVVDGTDRTNRFNNLVDTYYKPNATVEEKYNAFAEIRRLAGDIFSKEKIAKLNIGDNRDPENLIMALSDVLNKDIPNNTGYQEPFTIRNFLGNKELQRGGMDLTDKTKGFPQTLDQTIKTGGVSPLSPESGITLQKQIDAITSNTSLTGKQKMEAVAPLTKELDKLGLPYHSPEYTGNLSPESVPKVEGKPLTLYHGTDTPFEKFDLTKQSEGNLGKGIYLTDSDYAAKIYGKETVRNKQLAKGDLYGKTKDGVVLSVDISPNAKIKKIDYQPTYSEAQKIREQGFDGITYPDQTLQNTMGMPSTKAKTNATIIFNENVVKINKNLSPESVSKGTFKEYIANEASISKSEGRTIGEIPKNKWTNGDDILKQLGQNSPKTGTVEKNMLREPVGKLFVDTTYSEGVNGYLLRDDIGPVGFLRNNKNGIEMPKTTTKTIIPDELKSLFGEQPTGEKMTRIKVESPKIIKANQTYLKLKNTPESQWTPQDRIDFTNAKKILSPESKGTIKLKDNDLVKTFDETIKTTETPKIKLKTTPLEQPTGPELKQRGFSASVQEAPNVSKQVKQEVLGGYEPKPNDQLMGEAKALLTEGGSIKDVNKVQNIDAKITATIQEAINLDKIGKHDEAAALFNNLSTTGTELGRGVHAFALLNQMSPEAITLSAVGRIKKYNETAKVKIPELNGEQQKMISDTVKRIQGMTDERMKNIELNKLQEQISNFIPSSLSDKIITTWKAGLLTSPRTTLRNLAGNTIMQGSEMVSSKPASFADYLMSLKTGQRTTTGSLQGSLSGAKEGFSKSVDVMKYGFDPSESISKFDTKKITWGNNLVEQALKKYTDFVFNSLSAQDKPFWNSSYARSLYDQASAIAINQGNKGNKAIIENLVKNATEEMKVIATNDANYATFKDKNMISNIASNFKRVAGQKEWSKLPAEIVAPFTGVPSSVVAKTIDYSPIGLIKGIKNSGKVITQNVPELQRQAAQEIGRGTVGTAIFSLGAYLMSKGLMTGQPKDEAERKQWEIEGKQQNSVFINGKWRSINSVGPQTLVLLAGAKYNEEMNSPEGSIGKYGMNLAKDQLSQTFLSGVQQPLNAITDPERYGKSYVGGQVASFIPNIVKDTSKAFDPLARETDTGSFMGNVKTSVQSGIPVWRNQMTPKRDVLGNEIRQEPTGLGAYVDLFNSKTPIKNDVVNELSRLNEAGYNATPSKLQVTQTIKGVKGKLDQQQLDVLETKSGLATSTAIDKLIKTSGYQKLNDEDKKNAIDDLVTKTRKQVRSTIDLSVMPDMGYTTSADSPKGLGRVGLYGKSLITDPGQTLKAIIAGNPIRKVEGGAVILERKNALGTLDAGDKTTEVDHIIALTLGGTNDKSNLQVLSKAENRIKGQVETYLYNEMKAGRITKKEAQERDKNWKDEIDNLPQATKEKLVTELSTDTNDTETTGDTYQIINEDTGNITTIDLSKPIEEPEYTGFDELDKKLKSSYKSAITTRISNITKLYKDGQITAEKANKLISELKTKSGTGTKKKSKKKITFKVTSPKALPKITLKISSPVSRVKLKSAPKIKLSKTDNRKYTIKA